MPDMEDDLARHFKKAEMLHAQVGRLAAAFQFLEETLTGLVAFLLNPDHSAKGFAVACELSFKQKIQALRSLIRLEEPPNDNFVALYKRLYRAEENRNSVIHSRWHSGFPNDALVNRSKVTAKGKDGLKQHREEISLFWFNDVVDEVYTLIPDIEEYVANLPIEANYFSWKFKLQETR